MDHSLPCISVTQDKSFLLIIFFRCLTSVFFFSLNFGSTKAVFTHELISPYQLLRFTAGRTLGQNRPSYILHIVNSVCGTSSLKLHGQTHKSMNYFILIHFRKMFRMLKYLQLKYLLSNSNHPPPTS